MVLETALENVASKYSRHLEIIKPALEMLLQQVTEADSDICIVCCVSGGGQPRDQRITASARRQEKLGGVRTECRACQQGEHCEQEASMSWSCE